MRGTTERRSPGDTQNRARGYDFRRPDRFNREQVRGLEVVHELFARRFSSGLGGALRALVSVEGLSVDQLSFDDYVRSMPNPTVVCVVAVPPLPGFVTIEFDVPLALLLVDRLLGGRPGPAAAAELRRPTELETFLLRDLVEHGVAALREALGQVVEVAPELTLIEFNPQFVQVAPPSDGVLLLTYRMTVAQESTSEGLVTLCYPSSVLTPLLERVLEHAPGAERRDQVVDSGLSGPLADRLHDVEVALTVRLRDCQVPATDLVALRVGDVLRLDHRVDQPAIVEVGGVEVLTAHLGRRGRRLALQVERRGPGPDDAHAVRAAARSPR